METMKTILTKGSIINVAKVFVTTDKAFRETIGDDPDLNLGIRLMAHSLEANIFMISDKVLMTALDFRNHFIELITLVPNPDPMKVTFLTIVFAEISRILFPVEEGN